MFNENIHINSGLTPANLFLFGMFILLNGIASVTLAASVDRFVSPGGGGSACSQSAPCSLQTALGQSVNSDTIYLAGGTYTGSGAAVITVTHSISLYGGWDGTMTTPPVRDITLYPTIIDGEDQRRVVYVNQSTTPLIDGFTITGGNGTGLGGGLTPDSEAGGGIYSLNASPILQNNIISYNVASTLPGVRAFGGGVYISNETTSAIIQNNQIVGNSAGEAIAQGDGGGVFINGAADVMNNTFRDNVACNSCTNSNGGGAYIGWTDSGISISHNVFENNQAQKGGGLALVWSAVEVNNNTFTDGAAGNGSELYAYYDKGSNINGNEIISNTNSNTLYIYITLGPEATRLTNNIIADNQNTSAAVFAISDWHISAITISHNTLVSNGEGIKIGTNMTATLANNIVANHIVGIEVIDNGNVIADHTLFWGNTADGIRGTNPVDSDPAFVNPTEDYHIKAGSGAKNTGVNTGIQTDIDGDSRPQDGFYDIGADEFVKTDMYLFLPAILSRQKKSE